jgi:hypothetical protein
MEVSGGMYRQKRSWATMIAHLLGSFFLIIIKGQIKDNRSGKTRSFLSKVVAVFINA